MRAVETYRQGPSPWSFASVALYLVVYRRDPFPSEKLSRVFMHGHDDVQEDAAEYVRKAS